MGIICIFISDVYPDYFFIKSNRCNKVTSRPSVFSCKILRLPGESSRYRTLSLDIDNHTRYRVLRLDTDADMYVIWHQMPYYYLTLLLFHQFLQ
jgi:hypothetical protein